MVSLGTVVGAVDIVHADVAFNRTLGSLEGSTTANVSWRESEVAGIYLVDSADAENPCGSRFRALRHQLLVFARSPSSAENTDFIVGRAAAQRAAGVLSTTTPGPSLTAACSRHDLPLLLLAPRRRAFECVAQIQSLIVEEHLDRLTDPHRGPAEGPGDFPKLLELLHKGSI